MQSKPHSATEIVQATVLCVVSHLCIQKKFFTYLHWTFFLHFDIDTVNMKKTQINLS